MTREALNSSGGQIPDACITVHKEPGPGLPESVYVFALLKELELRGINAAAVMHPVYEAQMISYLKLRDKRSGYLVNFSVVRLKDGFRRFVNNF